MDADADALLDLTEFWVMSTRKHLDAEVLAWLIKLDLKAIDPEKMGRGRRHSVSQTAWINWLGAKDGFLADLPSRYKVSQEHQGMYSYV